MTRFVEQLLDQYDRPIAGAKVYVFKEDASLAALTDDGGGVLENPVVTDAFGAVIFNTDEGLYTLAYFVGGRLVRKDFTVVGDARRIFKGDKGDQGQPGIVTASGGVVTIRGALSGGGSESTVFHRVQAATGSHLSTNGTDCAVEVRQLVVTSRQTNGPPGNENYFNTVTNWMSNGGPNYLPLNTAFGSGRFAIESNFYQEGVFAQEIHISAFSTDGTEARPVSWFIPHDKANWGTKLKGSFQAAIITLYDGNGDYKGEINWVTGNISFQTATKFVHGVNNAPIVQQINAAGNAFVSGLYLNAADQWVLGNPLLLQSHLTLYGQLRALTAPEVTTLGTVVRKLAVYDTDGVLYGYLPIYDNIT